ncbi:hypothetical protein PILCRDRAFT_647499 [Piloderma croceum F 1598]|uniref:RGS domain-containing protein n=1 Tax=Piloderma croceum (strain F 1598) TaxID=765440 RepID=A0A0C3EV10_PILCF|nr:hypothetical protein PILCRDRAFT_647499 [Piloderma croceum F 1598]
MDTDHQCSLTDFEGYLLFREYSVENLQFVVWYQDYRRRFLDAVSNCHSRHSKVHVPNRVSIDRRATENHQDSPPAPGDDRGGTSEKEWPIQHEIPELGQVSSPDPATKTAPSSVRPIVSRHQSSTVNNGSRSSEDFVSFSQHRSLDAPPFKDECMRVVATFLRPDSPKELNLDAMIKDAIIRDLAHSTHPDVFLHAYREAYDMLETTSLPRFISHATANVNLQKQLYHYTVGFICYSVGIIIAITLIRTVNTNHKPHNRAWRLFAVPWFFSGTTTTYSSFRGICSQVGGRGNLQLRAWELEHEDEEAQISMRSIPGQHSRSTHSRRSSDERSLEESKIGNISEVAVPTPGEMAMIAPFATSASMTEQRARMVAPFADDVRADKPLIRPKIFGPERVVEDPRIKALHKRLIWEMYFLGICVAVMFSAIIFSVPCGHPR